MPNPTKSPAWMQDRALRLHGAFKALDLAAKLEGASLVEGWSRISGELHGTALEGGKILKATPSAVRDNWYKWERNGKNPGALIPGYTAARRLVPDELVAEWQRRVTMPTGGRNKKGVTNIAAIFASLANDWLTGKEIPGLGTWPEWWTANRPGLPVPPVAPEFPFDERTLRRYVPAKGLLKAGNVGFAAGKKHLPYVTLDYSKLRKCELFTFDDCRLDLVCLDESTGRVVEVVVYVAMEVASRSIAAFVAKPKGAIKAEDVDELTIRALQTEGYGIGDGYTTVLLYERGAIACSETCQAKLEGFTEDGIRVIRTGINGGIRWAGQAGDRSSGNWQGKAVIEAFNGILHGLLLMLPGQRGNNMENQPSNLGIELPKAVDPLKAERNRTLVSETERLHAARMAAIHAGADARVKLDVLTFSQLRSAVTEAIALYNRTPGRAFQGHSRRLEVEVQPGVWLPCDTAEQ